MNNAQPRCLVTGCALYLAGAADHAWGDLFQHGDRYIFNAVISIDPELGSQTVWVRDPRRAALPPIPELRIPVGCAYWERRGVFVLPADRSLLNEAALQRLGPPQAHWPFKQEAPSMEKIASLLRGGADNEGADHD